jgi:putative ABC transport system ATP-binding protein
MNNNGTKNGAPLLKLTGAGRAYQMGEVTVHALKNVELEVHEGDFLVVIGPSGSGKSTLLNLIGGMDRATSGEVLFKGDDLTKKSDRQLTLFRRREIGFIFQFYNLMPTLSALENIQVATEVVETPFDELEALLQVGLEDKADNFPSQLSGGQQQRVAIARALASNPSLLLCDEPTGALDSESARQTLDLLCHFHQNLNKTIVLITHDMAISRIGNRLAVIHDGEIVRREEITEPTQPKDIVW